MKTRGYEISLKRDNFLKYEAILVFHWQQGRPRLPIVKSLAQKNKFFAPFCDNIIIIAQNFPSKIARCCFLLRFYVPLRQNKWVNWILNIRTSESALLSIAVICISITVVKKTMCFHRV